MDLTTALFLILSGLTIFHIYIRKRRHGVLATRIPGPAPYPFIGNMLSFNISNNAALWNVVQDESKKYYPVTRVWMCTEALFVVLHPDDFEILLTHQKALEKAWVYDYLHPWLKAGLLTSKGEKWYQRRKMLTPSFHFNILSKYMDITREQGENMIKRLQASGKESIQNLTSFCSTVTLNIICESAMGVALNKLDKEELDTYKTAIYKLGAIVVYRMPRPYIQNWMLKLCSFLPMVRDQNKSLEHLHIFTTKVVKERKEYHQRTGNKYLREITDNIEETDDDVYKGSKKRLAMLDLLLAAEQEGLIDEEGIKEEVDTFTFEGHDTTATAMTFALLLLAENKEAQERARAELKEVFGEYDGKRNWKASDIQKLHYLERCIKESLRLYPPVSVVFRRITEEIQLKHAVFPAGAEILCNFYGLHRDPNFWSNPDKFDPDRFLPENSQGRHPFAYLPFSAGPRNCIGQKFAIAELKSLIGRILHNYYLEPIEPLSSITLQADLVIRPTKPVHLRFIKIDDTI